jgi:hypothetical protein
MTLNNVTIGNGDVYVQIDGGQHSQSSKKTEYGLQKRTGKSLFS